MSPDVLMALRNIYDPRKPAPEDVVFTLDAKPGEIGGRLSLELANVRIYPTSGFTI